MQSDGLEFCRIVRLVELAEAGDGTVTLDARAARDLVEAVRTNEWAVADLDEAKEKQEDAEENLRDARDRIRELEEAAEKASVTPDRELVARVTNDFNDLKARRKAVGRAG